MRDALVAAFAALALYGLVRGEMIGRTEGAVLMVVLVGYLFATYWLERRETGHTTFDEEASDFEDIAIRRNWIPPVLVAVGVGALVLGADLLVTGSVTIARDFGVSDAAIGLSLVALGTSLPELATAIVASCRRHAYVVLGNIIGSNIFNILAILGLTVLIQPIPVADRFASIDVLVMLGGSVGLLLLLFALRRIGRPVGIAMLAAYAGYVVLIFASG